MIYLNSKEFIPRYFPDGTLNMNYMYSLVADNWHDTNRITWFFDSDKEFMQIYFIKNWLEEAFNFMDTELRLMYLPNARMDRVKNQLDEVPTLKYFAKLINSMNFKNVVLLDPHSSVAENLFNNVKIDDTFNYILSIIASLKSDGDNSKLTLFYPDEGAMKRYSSDISEPYCFGVKKRKWKTGEIESLQVVGDQQLIENSDILIIDDICSAGGTFFHSAKKLKELGAKNIYLYVTHCEDSIFIGELFKEENKNLIEHIFTTNSLIRLNKFSVSEEAKNKLTIRDLMRGDY